MAIDDMASHYKEQEVKLDASFGSVNSKATKSNKLVNEALERQTADLGQEVYKAWQVLYKEQKEQNPLPEELPPGFKKQFESLKPQKDLSNKNRDYYRDNIKKHLPKLLEIGDIYRQADTEEKGSDKTKDASKSPQIGNIVGAGKQPTDTSKNSDKENWIGTVHWDSTEYEAILKNYDWVEAPSTQTILLRQEDLWVYETLLRVIAATNKGVGATNPANAAVKRILSLQIAEKAIQTWKSTGNLVFKTNASAPSAQPATDATATGRYVDDKGNQTPNTETPSEFKLMPFCLDLEIDQSKLPTLLAACANASMPIEIHRIRLKGSYGEIIALVPPTPVTKVASDAAKSGKSGKPDNMPDSKLDGKIKPPASTPSPSASIPKPTAPSGKTNPEQDQNVLPVEIQGTICIYNPPDVSKLGAGALAEKEKEKEKAKEKERLKEKEENTKESGKTSDKKITDSQDAEKKSTDNGGKSEEKKDVDDKSQPASGENKPEDPSAPAKSPSLNDGGKS
jgi:hypothetical protein